MKIRRRSTVVVVHEGKVLGFHAEDPHSGKKYFFLPGGKIEEGESPRSSAVREAFEETGYIVVLDPDREVFRKYEFEWGGSINECHTWFYRGHLEPAGQCPSPVSDASYHRGVDWMPVVQAPEVFAYHPSILEAVLTLI